MNKITNIVQQALKIGYLTIEAEQNLRVILADQYDLEDLENFMILQNLLISGKLKQQSRDVNSCFTTRDLEKP